MHPIDGLRTHFGFDAFRPGQEAAVSAALAGRDALVVMPTGSGKSLCFALPALMSDRLAIVVSPLVSLMQDQVDALIRLAPGKVGLVNALQGSERNRAALRRARAGELRLLYVAPERFRGPGFEAELRGIPIGLFAVDEAHCVSQWGHDFRPDYLRLGAVARRLGARSLLASTATATPAVATDIVAALGLQDPVVVRTGFDRPNLEFSVAELASAAQVERAAVEVLRAPRGLPAIVYAGTRAGCERLAPALARALERPVLTYHAGMDRDRREQAQARFMAGEVDVLVATNAFGMGVDKRDVRTVCHVSVPGSLEAYYQEAGRAGRDGARSRCVVLVARGERQRHVWRARQDTERNRWRRLRAMWTYVDGGRCRRAIVLEHFGDRVDDAATRDRTGCCDVCDPRLRREAERWTGCGADGALGGGDGLDAAILAVAGAARPPVDAARAAEILRGERTRAVRRHSYDGLPGFGTFPTVPAVEIRARFATLAAAGWRTEAVAA